MGKKCCVETCHSNKNKSRAHKNEALRKKNDCKNEENFNIPTFGFPSDANEKNRWIAAIPYLNEDKYNSYKCPPRVCIKHWPTNFEETKSINGRVRPLNPPSVFFGVPSSQIPTPPPKPRTTTMATSEARTTKEDELPEFTKADKVTYESLCDSVHAHEMCAAVISYQVNNSLWIQSTDFLSGIPKFALKVFRDLTFEAFYTGVQCKVTTLGKRLNAWSKLDEAVRFLRCVEPSQHVKVLTEQIDCMKPAKVGEKVIGSHGWICDKTRYS